MNSDSLKKQCLCCSGKLYQACCAPLLSGVKKAKTPVQLMRSRYCAYAQGGYGDYLLATWLPASRAGLSAAELSLKSADWVRLEVLSKAQNGDKGLVEFNAYYLDDDDATEQVHHERSIFHRVGGKWFYVGVQ